MTEEELAGCYAKSSIMPSDHEPDLHDYYRILAQRDSMAVYLKRTCQCECCLHKMERPYPNRCPDCDLGGASKWEWGGWKGKPDPNSATAWRNQDYLFQTWDRILNYYAQMENEISTEGNETNEPKRDI